VVKWLPLLLRIRQVPDSNLGLGDQLFWLKVFRGFPHSLQLNAVIVPNIRPRPLPTKFFPIHHRPFVHAMQCSYWKSVVKWTTNHPKEVLNTTWRAMMLIGQPR
jgi:hypothetical protein